MRTGTTAITALLLAAALVGCSSGSEENSDAKPKTSAAAPSADTTNAPTAKDVKLEPEWAPKLEATQQDATADCMAPSSTACSEAVERIMTVVRGLDAAIDQSGKRYAQTTAQIVKMQDAEKVYIDEGCAGDPAADDPNSPCTKVVAITVGASTLQMTLITDDLA
ncbi:hypothetical protein HW130_34510 [Streptomyces sp. PKU-EA00015]|uniref:hypothetical protein n=1 Tax=Streptomyces sp. PKU-EA00015 TaxID=2748326 RepID=UPI0015A33FD2|nr:hypothetical protein [Streptomyces sp. PKU-EA00015]NWF31281.1 hypothetical protein [Streptomyces sp. PKU-EA00015]